jgi:acetyl esterase/lipase
VTTVGAIVLLFGGLVAITATWNAAKPVRDPTRRYSPSWLPAMVVTELAPFWLLVTLVVLIGGTLAGGHRNLGGFAGSLLLVVSSLLLLYLSARSRTAARWLFPLVDGEVPPALGVARVTGLPVPTPPGVSEEHGVEYAGGCTLDMISPERLPERAPVFVYVHGGGWTNGDPQRQARDLYHALARAGWVVLAIRYPLAPAVTVEHQIDTVLDAVAWARRGLPRHGVTPSRVALGGGSAGAHLATMAALTPRHDHEQVDACVGIYGIYDMANRNRTRAPWAKIRNEVMLATVEEAPDRYRAVSPLDRVHAGSPPILLVHGTHDTLVPIGEAEQFADALRAADRPVELVSIHGAQHAFDAVGAITSRTSAAVIRDWLARTLRP